MICDWIIYVYTFWQKYTCTNKPTHKYCGKQDDYFYIRLKKMDGRSTNNVRVKLKIEAVMTYNCKYGINQYIHWSAINCHTWTKSGPLLLFLTFRYFFRDISIWYTYCLSFNSSIDCYPSYLPINSVILWLPIIYGYLCKLLLYRYSYTQIIPIKL